MFKKAIAKVIVFFMHLNIMSGDCFLYASKYNVSELLPMFDDKTVASYLVLTA